MCGVWWCLLRGAVGMCRRRRRELRADRSVCWSAQNCSGWNRVGLRLARVRYRGRGTADRCQGKRARVHACARACVQDGARAVAGVRVCLRASVMCLQVELSEITGLPARSPRRPTRYPGFHPVCSEGRARRIWFRKPLRQREGVRCPGRISCAPGGRAACNPNWRLVRWWVWGAGEGVCGHAGGRQAEEGRKQRKRFPGRHQHCLLPVRVSPESSGLVNLISCQNSHDNESRPAAWHHGSSTAAGEIARLIYEQEIALRWHRPAARPAVPAALPGPHGRDPSGRTAPGPGFPWGDPGTAAPEENLILTRSLPTRADAVPSTV